MMIYVCLWSPRWETGEAFLDDVAGALLEIAPRIALDGRGVVWADARGLPARDIARELLARAGGAGREVRAAISAVPVAAEMAARRGAGSPDGRGTLVRRTEGPAAGENRIEAGELPRVTVVPSGEERRYIAPLPLELLNPDPRLLTLLRGVGVHTCGDLASLSREAVEVRFGAPAGALWRLSRADDRRILFRPVPRERPHASLDFVEYEVREAGRLVFTVNALLGSVSETLDSRGERARSMTLSLSLAGGGVERERLLASRPTADRGFWIRRLQDLLERIRLPEPVLGVSLEVDGTEPRSATQGDLFDRGFASASAVEEAVGRLLDEQGPVLVAPERDGHPLAERRTRWIPRTAGEVAGRSGAGGAPGSGQAPSAPVPGRTARGRGLKIETGSAPGSAVGQDRSGPGYSGSSREQRDRPGPTLLTGADASPCLTLQLLPEPRALGVRIAFRGVQILPQAYLYAGAWHGVAVAAGPDRLSGGRWEAKSFARDYFRCITEEGRLVWIYRDLEENRWYLHGWWE